MPVAPPRRIEARSPPAHRPRLWYAVARTVAVALLAVAAPAVAGPYNPEHLAPSDHAQVAGLCQAVMGLSGGNAQYDACLEALSASVRAQAGAQGLVRARSDCLGRGAAPGSPALATCELERSRVYGADAGAAVLPVGAALTSRPSRSYWLASNAEVHRREESACADLGLELVGQAFARCVAGLDASLFNANNPSQ